MKRRNFTLSIKENQDDFRLAVEQFPKWAWIIHDKDVNKETGEKIEPHTHAYIEVPNPRSFSSVAESLAVPDHMVCKIIDKKALLQYFTHKNQPEKYQYDITDIHSNFDVLPFYENNSSALWENYNNLRRGLIEPNQFYELHKSEIDSNSFYQKLRIFEMISKPTRDNTFYIK